MCASPEIHDIINGRGVPPTIVNADYVQTGTHQGSFLVRAGVFLLRGVVQGSLAIERDSNATILGKLQGSVSLEPGATVIVQGAIEGSASVCAGAQLIIENGGKLAGSLHNEGEVVVRGAFGGSTSGSRQLRLEGDGYVKQPVTRDGANYYEW